jgi:phosphate transport system substrate-binding protein
MTADSAANKKILRKATLLVARALLTAFLLGLSAWFLQTREFLQSAGEIDNLFSLLTPAFLSLFNLIAIVLVWYTPRRKILRPYLCLTLLALSSLCLFFPSVTQHWWFYRQDAAETTTTAGGEPDLSAYLPFEDGGKVVRLPYQASLRLKQDLPTLDGAKALFPLYAAFVRATYEEDEYVCHKDILACTNTPGAYESIIRGDVDVIFVAAPSARQKERAKELGADLQFTPIGREAFVFLTGKDNPVDNITFRQVRNIYSGKTAYWKTLGWAGGGKIIAFQRPDGSGSQTGLQRIMGDVPIVQPQPLPDSGLVGTNSLMRQISVQWQGVQPAIGYSYRYYAVSMFPNTEAKLLSLEGVAPTVENIRAGVYPAAAEFFAVTNRKPRGNARLLIDWILSPEGQEIIERTGYVPIRP